MASPRPLPFVCLFVLAVSPLAHAQPDAADNPTTVEIRSDIPIPAPQNPAADNPAAPQPHPHPDPDTLAKFAQALRITPNNLSFSSNISYDEHGQPRHQSSNGSVNFSVKYDETVQPIAYDGFRLTRVVADTGAEITVHQDNRHRQSNQFGRNQQGQAGGSFNLYTNNFPLPPADASSLAIVEGVFDLRYADGQPQPAVFDAFGDFDGIWVGIEQLPDSRIRVSRVGQRVRVDFDPGSFKRFAYPEFFTADRTSINVSGWSSSSNNGGINRSYNIDLDAKGRVVLWFYPEVKTISIPFRVRNLALPERPQSDGVDLVIRLGDDPAKIEQAKPGQPEPAGLPNELKIVVPDKADAG
ncbi:MAG: hypothetical protein AAGI68_01545 [Planctomycetota bacterium]